MSLRDRIQADLKDAMRARDEVRVSTLRLIQAAIKDRDIAARAEDRCEGCGQEEILAILQKLLSSVRKARRPMKTRAGWTWPSASSARR